MIETRTRETDTSATRRRDGSQQSHAAFIGDLPPTGETVGDLEAQAASPGIALEHDPMDASLLTLFFDD